MKQKKVTSILKIYQVLSSLSLSDVGTYLRDAPFESDVGIVNLHPSKGTNWVAYKSKIFLTHMVMPFLKNNLKSL